MMIYDKVDTVNLYSKSDFKKRKNLSDKKLENSFPKV